MKRFFIAAVSCLLLFASSVSAQTFTEVATTSGGLSVTYPVRGESHYYANATLGDYTIAMGEQSKGFGIQIEYGSDITANYEFAGISGDEPAEVVVDAWLASNAQMGFADFDEAERSTETFPSGNAVIQPFNYGGMDALLIGIDITSGSTALVLVTVDTNSDTSLSEGMDELISIVRTITIGDPLPFGDSGSTEPVNESGSSSSESTLPTTPPLETDPTPANMRAKSGLQVTYPDDFYIPNVLGSASLYLLDRRSQAFGIEIYYGVDMTMTSGDSAVEVVENYLLADTSKVWDVSDRSVEALQNGIVIIQPYQLNGRGYLAIGIDFSSGEVVFVKVGGSVDISTALNWDELLAILGTITFGDTLPLQYMTSADAVAANCILLGDMPANTIIFSEGGSFAYPDEWQLVTEDCVATEVVFDSDNRQDEITVSVYSITDEMNPEVFKNDTMMAIAENLELTEYDPGEFYIPTDTRLLSIFTELITDGRAYELYYRSVGENRARHPFLAVIIVPLDKAHFGVVRALINTPGYELEGEIQEVAISFVI